MADLAADTTTTGRINIGNDPLRGPVVTVSGTFEDRSDVDWFAITMEAGQGYSFDLRTRGSSSGDGDPLIVGIYDSSGNLISNTGDDDGGTGNSARVHFKAPPDGGGTYYIAVGQETGNTATSYTLRVREDDWSQKFPGTAGTIVVDGRTRAKIEVKDDEDWFAVQLENGKAYEVRVSPASNPSVNSPVIYGVWETTGGRPAIISGTTSNTFGESVRFIAPGDGTYYVHVRALDAGTGRGYYDLYVEEAEDDYGDSPLNPGTLQLNDYNSRLNANINYEGDIDWFQVTLEAGRTYNFHVWDEGGSDMVIEGLWTPTWLHNRMIPGTYNDDTSDTDDDSRLTYTPTFTGTYYLAVSSESDKGRTPNSEGIIHGYHVVAMDVTPSGTGLGGPRPVTSDDHAESGQDEGALTAGALTVGTPVMGIIEVRHDRDWFKVALTAGTSYEINLQGAKTNKGTLYDPLLGGIHDSNGNLISGTIDDDGGDSLNSRLTFTPDSSGDYYISAAGWGAATGTYELSIDAI